MAVCARLIIDTRSMRDQCAINSGVVLAPSSLRVTPPSTNSR